MSVAEYIMYSGTGCKKIQSYRLLLPRCAFASNKGYDIRISLSLCRNEDWFFRTFWFLLLDIEIWDESGELEWKHRSNSGAFAVIDTSPRLMKGKQREHTDARRTLVCTRAEHTGSASTRQTLLCLRTGVKGLPLYTAEDWDESRCVYATAAVCASAPRPVVKSENMSLFPDCVANDVW